MFYNYKKFFLIVLQGFVDANYKFVNIDVGGYGKQSDGETPKGVCLPNSDITVPYAMIADEAYPLLPNLLKPLLKTTFRCIQRTGECAFEILGTAVETSIDDIVKCIYLLHNIMIDK